MRCASPAATHRAPSVSSSVLRRAGCCGLAARTATTTRRECPGRPGGLPPPRTPRNACGVRLRRELANARRGARAGTNPSRSRSDGFGRLQRWLFKAGDRRRLTCLKWSVGGPVRSVRSSSGPSARPPSGSSSGSSVGVRLGADHVGFPVTTRGRGRSAGHQAWRASLRRKLAGGGRLEAASGGRLRRGAPRRALRAQRLEVPLQASRGFRRFELHFHRTSSKRFYSLLTCACTRSRREIAFYAG
jgi:hypothetical protein